MKRHTFPHASSLQPHASSLKPRMPADDRRPTLTPPQFGLRTLLLIVSLCAVIFASFQWLSPLAIVGLIFLVICIAAHIAGNAIGTRLRENGSRPLPPHHLEPHSARFPAVSTAEFAEATQLSRHSSLGWPQMFATLAGIAAGGIGGGLGTILLSREYNEATVLIGAIAFAALGGMAAFIGYSFVQVALSTIAHAESGAEAQTDGRRSPDS